MHKQPRHKGPLISYRCCVAGKPVLMASEYNLEEREQGSCAEVINSFPNYSGQTHARRRKINLANLCIPPLSPRKDERLFGQTGRDLGLLSGLLWRVMTQSCFKVKWVPPESRDALRSSSAVSVTC